MSATALDTAPQAFLGVEKSLRGQLWLGRGGDEAIALAISQKLGVEELVGRVLAGRGVGLSEAASFLDPSLREYLSDPFVLQDMELAATRIAGAIAANETITIFGDYDVDGATSAALLSRFVRAAGGRTGIYIPDRVKEGYGPSAAAFRKLAGQGASLIVTVDCGISAQEAVEEAGRAGVDIIIIDHHLAGQTLPPALACVNPNRLDDLSGYGHLAAVGVTFLLIVALNRMLRKNGQYNNCPEPDLLQWLDLVALGTVCDVVPLTGLNRAYVAQGLKVMGFRGNAGLAALARTAGIAGDMDSYHAGFVLGPRINAAGRIGDASLGARLLSTDDDAEACRIADELEQLNAGRREIEAQVLEEAEARAEKLLSDDPDIPLLVVAASGWHQGVIGIAAGRLKERYGLPAIVISLDGGEGKGSGRSISGVDLGSAINEAASNSLIIKGGGHKMAAGLSLSEDQLEEFTSFMTTRLQSEVRVAVANRSLKIDGALTARGASKQLIRSLERAGPFGPANPKPVFAFPAHHVSYADIVGQNHIRCTLRASDGAKLSAMAFRAADTQWGRHLLEERQMPLHVAGKLKLDKWQGRETVKLFIDDAAIPAKHM